MEQLCEAMGREDARRVRELLDEEHGFRLLQPVISCRGKEQSGIVKLLIKARADINTESSYRGTALLNSWL